MIPGPLLADETLKLSWGKACWEAIFWIQQPAEAEAAYRKVMELRKLEYLAERRRVDLDALPYETRQGFYSYSPAEGDFVWQTDRDTSGKSFCKPLLPVIQITKMGRCVISGLQFPSILGQ